MIFIIFGTRSRATTTDTGRFFCPACGKRRPYDLKEVRRHGTLYFIPVLPLDKVGEYVECKKCGATFYPKVLNSMPELRSRQIEARFHKGVRGVLVHMMLADGNTTGAELETVRRVYRSVTGTELDEKRLHKQARSKKWTRKLGLVASLSALSRTLNDQGKEVILRAAARVATVDGRVGPEEHDLLLEIGDSLDMTKKDVGRIFDSMGIPTSPKGFHITEKDASAAAMPASVAEAVPIIIEQLSAEEVEQLRKLERNELIGLHFGLGMWIRNHLGLWEGNQSLLKDTGKIDPDDASMVILQAVWEELQGDKKSWWRRIGQ